MCVTLLMQLEGNPEKLSDRLSALERVALFFSLLNVPVKPAKRHAAAQAMLSSMHDVERIPKAYKLATEERAACAEGLRAPFEGVKRVKVATAILVKLNAHENWEGSETSGVESVVTLEHVLPQKPDKASWEEAWPDAEKRGEWLHRLGNLAIVNRKMNSKMNNGGFAAKKMEFKKSPFPRTRAIADHDSWEERDVKKAQRCVVELANSVFDVG